jgi:hypothetical protein
MSTDLALGLLTLVIAVGYYVMAAAIPASALADPVGAQGLPTVYAVILGALSFVLIARGLAGRRRLPPSPATDTAGTERGERDRGEANRTAVTRGDVGGDGADTQPRASWRASWRELRRAAGMLLIGVGYVVLVPYLGYILAIAALIVATTAYQGGVLNGRVVAVGFSGALVLWVLFVMLLGVPQPSGSWPSFF